jgi:hypothetical protein
VGASESTREIYVGAGELALDNAFVVPGTRGIAAESAIVGREFALPGADAVLPSQKADGVTLGGGILTPGYRDDTLGCVALGTWYSSAGNSGVTVTRGSNSAAERRANLLAAGRGLRSLARRAMVLLIERYLSPHFIQKMHILR